MATCGSSMVTCPACKGSGLASVACESCQSTGKSGGRECGACQGRGKRASDTKHPKDCERCRGRGSIVALPGA